MNKRILIVIATFKTERNTIMKKYLLGVVCAFLLYLFGSVSPANAALFSVDFNDYDGPHWTGYIDTTNDTLTITGWTENPEPSWQHFWSPADTSIPMIWDAVNGSGLGYDVPDNWDGTFGTNWGFLSRVPLSEINFVDGDCTLNDFIPGWHIYKIISTNYIATNTGTNRMSPWPRWSDFSGIVWADSVQVTAIVPIPGAVWLFGSGLIGFIGLRRKLKK